MQNLKRGLIGAALLTIVLLVLLRWSTDELGGSPMMQQTATDTPASDSYPSGISQHSFLSTMPPGDWTEWADAVAEVDVLEVGEPRFYTESGAFPSPAPTGEPLDDLGLFSAVVLEAAVTFKTDTEEIPVGYVVPRVGGELDGFEHQFTPFTDYLEGSEGIVFLSALPQSWVDNPETSNPPHWFHYLQSIADQHSGSQGEYRVMKALVWYQFNTDATEATCSLDGQVFDTVDLAGEIKAALEGE